MKNDFDLPYIAKNLNELKAFILGEGIYRTVHADNDYVRWHYLEKFYKGLAIDSELRENIEKVVLDLFSAEDIFKKLTSIILGRVLNLNEAQVRLREVIVTDSYKEFPEKLQREVFNSATKLQLTDVAFHIVGYYFEREKLDEYLLNASKSFTFDNVIVEYDIWRVNSIVRYYTMLDYRKQSFMKIQIISIISAEKKVQQLFIALYKMIGDTEPFFLEDDVRKSLNLEPYPQ